MERISGMSFDFYMMGFPIHVESVNLSISDNSAVALTRGIPDGWVSGDVAAEGEIELDSKNFQKQKKPSQTLLERLHIKLLLMNLKGRHRLTVVLLQPNQDAFFHKSGLIQFLHRAKRVSLLLQHASLLRHHYHNKDKYLI